MRVFQQVLGTSERHQLADFQLPYWTWTRAARIALHSWSTIVTASPEPELRDVCPGSAYGYTFSLPASLQLPPRLESDMAAIATELYHLPRTHEIVLLDQILGPWLTPKGLRLLFAYLRDVLATVHGHAMGCVYAPLSDVGTHAGSFPLHADLYPAEMVMNVFEDVPSDGSGASLFLPVARFLEILASTSGVPERTRARLASCLSEPSDEDRFHAFFDLLYDARAPWGSELTTRMRADQLRVPLRRGQGYLLHDRSWLHGREAPSGGVSRARLHRLAFATLSKPLAHAAAA